MNQSRSNEGMSLIVKTVCGWLKAFILLYGIHIILYGHLTPGGGFAGGVIAASAFVLIMLAEGEAVGLKTFSRKAASTWDSVGWTGVSGHGRTGTRAGREPFSLTSGRPTSPPISRCSAAASYPPATSGSG